MVAEIPCGAGSGRNLRLGLPFAASRDCLRVAQTNTGQSVSLHHVTAPTDLEGRPEYVPHDVSQSLALTSEGWGTAPPRQVRPRSLVVRSSPDWLVNRTNAVYMSLIVPYRGGRVAMSGGIPSPEQHLFRTLEPIVSRVWQPRGKHNKMAPIGKPTTPPPEYRVFDFQPNLC